MGEEFWVVTEFLHVGDVVGEVVNELVGERHIAAAVVAEVENEVGDAGLVDFGDGAGEVIFKAGVVGIVDAAEDGGGFVAAKLILEPDAESGPDPGLGHAEAVEDSGFIEAGVELEIGEILGGKEAVIKGMAGGRGDGVAGAAFAMPFYWIGIWMVAGLQSERRMTFERESEVVG